MLNPIKITGSAVQRLKIADEILETVFPKIEGRRLASPERLEVELNQMLPFNLKIEPIEGSDAEGVFAPALSFKNKFAGGTLKLPYDSVSGKLKLGGDHTVTFMHELGHAVHYKVDPRIPATVLAVRNWAISMMNGAQNVDFLANFRHKAKRLYENVLYNCELSAEQKGKFKEALLTGGDAEKQAVKERLANISHKVDEAFSDHVDLDVKLIFLKEFRNGLRTEDFSWSRGAKYKVQESLDKSIKTLIKRENIDELISLQKSSEAAYTAKLNNIFENAGIASKQKQLDSELTDTKYVHYMFKEKIQLLNKKIAENIAEQRKIQAQQRLSTT